MSLFRNVKQTHFNGWKKWNMSFKYNINQIGPNMDPCGTIRFILDRSEIILLTKTACFCSLNMI